MAVPPLSGEQRREALVRAQRARQARSEVKAKLGRGDITLAEVIDAGLTDDAIARMPVYDLLTALPGIGAARAHRLMEEIVIARNRRVRGLGDHQIAELLRRVGRR